MAADVAGGLDHRRHRCSAPYKGCCHNPRCSTVQHDISGCMTAFRVAQGCGEQRTPEVEVQAAPVAAAAEQAVYGLQGIVVVGSNSRDL